MKRTLFYHLMMSMLLASCTSTYLTSSWKKENLPEKSYQKVLVLGVTDRQAARAQGEMALVKELQKEGINAYASHLAFPEFRDEKPSKEKLEDSMKEKNFDGVFTITVLDVKEDQHYVPGQAYVEPIYLYHRSPVFFNPGYIYRDRPFYSYYTTMYTTVYEPGYMTSTTRIFLETNFYDLETGELVWSAQTESIDPNGLKMLAKDYAKAVMNGLEEENLLISDPE